MHQSSKYTIISPTAAANDLIALGPDEVVMPNDHVVAVIELNLTHYSEGKGALRLLLRDLTKILTPLEKNQ